MRKRVREFNRKSNKVGSQGSNLESAPCLQTWSALEEHLIHKPDSIGTITVRASNEKKLRQILDQYSMSGTTVRVSDEIGSPIAAELRVNEYTEDELFDALNFEKPRIIVMLDQITDTRNLGSIARTAAFFGIKWMIMPRDRQASITTATLSAAQGAFAHVNSATVVNLARVIDRLKDELNYWVIGTAMQGEPIKNLIGQYDHVVVILGNEATGMRSLTAKKCDRITTIPGHETRVESLNIAVAAGICLHELSSSR